MRILFDGGYTLHSAGDDAPLSFLGDELRTHLADDLELIVVARHPNEEFDRRYGVRTVRGLEHETKTQSIGRWFRGFNYDDDRGALRVLSDLVAESDLLVLGAGNFLTEVGIDVLRGHLPRFAVMAGIAELAGTPTLLYGLSANHLTDPWAARTARWLLHAADAVTFREHRAVEVLTASGIELPKYEVLPDPALGSREPESGSGEQILLAEGIPLAVGPRLALAPRDLSWLEIHDQYLVNQIKIVDGWLRKAPEADVLIVPQCTYEDAPHTDDRVIGQLIAERSSAPTRVHMIRRHLPHWEVEASYATADVAIATRLHGSVFSARRGTPVVGLAYESKVTGFFGSIGFPELCLPADASAKTILAIADRAYKDRKILGAQLRDRTSKLRTELQRYVQIAVELAERPRRNRP